MLPGNIIPKKPYGVCYVVEPHNWAIAADGANIAENIELLYPTLRMQVTQHPYLSRAPVVHFGSQFMFQNWAEFMPKDDKIVVTYFHGEYGKDVVIDKNLEFLIDNHNRVRQIIVSFELMQDRLISLGIPAEKISRIPVGVSTALFSLNSSNEKTSGIRHRLRIPQGYKVIGSFQKDGEGWGTGITPKLIKGPDIFVEAVRKISDTQPICVLLSGPARGYMKSELKKYRIPYIHHFARSPRDMVDLYHATDLYIVASREEGGPKGLLEALAVGCPVVTTPVGMATDLRSSSGYFSILDSFEASQIAYEAIQILENLPSQRERQTLRNHVLEYDWAEIAKLHQAEVYAPLLNH